jgi:hypothetical protein
VSCQSVPLTCCRVVWGARKQPASYTLCSFDDRWMVALPLPLVPRVTSAQQWQYPCRSPQPDSLITGACPAAQPVQARHTHSRWLCQSATQRCYINRWCAGLRFDINRWCVTSSFCPLCYCDGVSHLVSVPCATVMVCHIFFLSLVLQFNRCPNLHPSHLEVPTLVML